MSSSEKAEENGRFKPPRGLQTILSVTFFLILLFMVNAIAGAIWLAARGLQTDAIIFSIMFVIGSVLLFYVGIFLFAASHSEVNLGPDKATMVLPNWRGPTPFFPYTECSVPYNDLAAVETRSEIYRYLVLPVIVRSACLVRKDGRRLTLGYVQESPQDPWIPFHRIADQIAEKAGVQVVNRGVVEGKSGLRALIQDEPPWDAPEVDQEKLEKVRRSEKTGWMILVGIIGVIVVGSILFQASRFFG